MEWMAVSLGNAKGRIAVNDTEFGIKPGQPPFPLGELNPQDRLIIQCENGKFSDYEDSFLFVFAQIRPDEENITLSAVFHAETAGAYCGRQSGYGILFADTVDNADRRNGYRNHVAAGRFRIRKTEAVGYGMRTVSGHLSSEVNTGRHMLDASREASFPSATLIQAGEKAAFSLEKDNAGYRARVCAGTDTEEFFYPGTDILTKQDPDWIYAGFAAAGDLTAAVSGIQCCIEPGRLSHTPEEAIQFVSYDYPFARSTLAEPEPWKGSPSSGDTVVIPPGTHSLMDAVQEGINGRTFVLQDGVHHLQSSVCIPRNSTCSIIAEHPGKAVIDGAGIAAGTPALIIHGNDCLISGISVTNSPSAGIHVCGRNNRIERCSAYRNKDTGILICAWPGEDRSEWPSGNCILNCDAWDNCDEARSNADGFGAKLTIGEGNVLEGCFAHHNIDDGFDLFTKGIHGPTGPVRMVGCAAWQNGFLSTDTERGDGRTGTGFKLGGDRQSVEHRVEHCIAWDNDGYGFSTNSNPSDILHSLVSVYNRKGDYLLSAYRKDPAPSWNCRDLFPEKSIRAFCDDIVLEKNRMTQEEYNAACRERALPDRDLPLQRAEDGSLNLDPFFPPAMCGRRILFVVPRISGGGAEKVMTALASELAENNDVCIVETISKNGNEEYPVSPRVSLRSIPVENEQQTNTIVKRLAKRILPGILKAWLSEQGQRSRVQALKEIKQAFRPDCSISFLNSANWLNAASSIGERTIVSIRSYPAGRYAPAELRRAEGRILLQKACRKADTVAAVSRETGYRMVQSFGVDPAKLQVIYNACDAEAIRKRSEEPLPEDLPFRLDDGGFTFFNTGRLTEKKGQWHLVRAFRMVVDKHPEARLVILGRRGKGKEDTWDLVEDTIRNNHLENHVFLVGFRMNPYAYLSKGNAYVMASFNEGFPNALIEAMALSLPVIAADCSAGPREILAPDTDCSKKTRTIDYADYGILVPECSGRKALPDRLENEERILGEAMIRLMEDVELRQQYSIRAAYRAKRFDKQKILNQWSALIEKGGRQND